MLLDPHIQRSLLNDILAATPGTERAVALEKRKDLVERYTLVFVRMGRNYGEPDRWGLYFGDLDVWACLTWLFTKRSAKNGGNDLSTNTGVGVDVVLSPRESEYLHFVTSSAFHNTM